MIKRYLTLFLFELVSVVSVAQTVTGTIDNYIGNIIDNLPSSTGDDYSQPSTTELNIWNSIISDVLIENITSARSSASTVNYQITEFTDTSVNQVFYVLEEKEPQSNYWGTYVFSKTPTRNNLIIQAPHSKYDTNTGKQAVFCFKNMVAKALFINGTHRCNSSSFSSCSGTTSVCGSSGQNYRISDLAHTTASIFQKTTENLFNAISNSVFIQLHGFGKRSSDPYVIISNGTRNTPAIDYASLIKDALLQEDTSLTFKLAHIDTSWTRLIGFTNTQGRLINNSSNYCLDAATDTSGRFIHIEQERTKLRSNQSGWLKMSNALLTVFSSTLSRDDLYIHRDVVVFPNPTTNNKININTKDLIVTSIEVYNVNGQRIKTQTNKNSFIDLTNHAKGIYFLKIKVLKGLVYKKVILF